VNGERDLNGLASKEPESNDIVSSVDQCSNVDQNTANVWNVGTQENVSQIPSEQSERRYPLRERKQRIMFPDHRSYLSYLANSSISEPTTVKEALSGSDKEFWEKAFREELGSFSENKAWELVDLPVNERVLPTK